MRTLIRLISVVLLCVSIQHFGIAQTMDDQAKVLQKCIDLTEIQQYYPLDNAGNPAQLFVMNYAVTFPAGVNVAKAGQKLLFLSREEIMQQKISSYFIFRSFEVTDNSAKAVFSYFYTYDYTNSQFKMVMVNVEMGKVDQDWSVINIKIGGDTK